jgi:hypothetical protein
MTSHHALVVRGGAKVGIIGFGQITARVAVFKGAEDVAERKEDVWPLAKTSGPPRPPRRFRNGRNGKGRVST